MRNIIKTTDPLDSLIAEDTKEIDRKRLADFLQIYIQLDKASKLINPLPKLQKVTPNDHKVEIVLLASKARALVFELPNGMLPSDIIDLEILPIGSIKTSLKRLYDSRKARKDKNGRYYLPNYRIYEILDRKDKDNG